MNSTSNLFRYTNCFINVTVIQQTFNLLDTQINVIQQLIQNIQDVIVQQLHWV